MKIPPWTGVDLDGTLAYYDKWVGLEVVGEPIPLMVKRVQQMLDNNYRVKIFTARVSSLSGDELTAAVAAINDFSMSNFGQVLPITCCKDMGMVDIWDDRAKQIEKNTGRMLTPDGWK